jgi:DNA-binding NarL/FixJ family response regulator
MNDPAGLLQDARDAFARRDWVRARAAFETARARATLSSDDTYAAADAAWWLGLIDEALAAYEDAYHLYLREHRPRKAANSALGIGYTLALRGDGAIGSGWMSRAVRLLEGEAESVEHGYLVFIEIETALGAGELESAIVRSRDLQEMGRRFADPTLTALGVVGEGRALIKRGQVSRGLALLDEGMLAAVSEEMDPSWAGNIYCSLMIACHELADVRRAAEWTQATARWCESMPAAGPFMGICRVHRAQILQLQGGWDDAEREAIRVCAELAHFDVGTVAEAHYQLGEVCRLRGRLAAAEDAYRHAHAMGRDPQPGLALLRLAQGRAAAAAASIQTALAGEARNRLVRARLCAAQVEIALAAGEMDVARRAGDELEEIAGVYGSSGFEAAALQARGAILLAEGQATAALQTLRAACLRWQRLNAPYETARVRVLLARLYEALGDRDAAALELDAAAAVFDRLGARLDARTVAELRDRPLLPGDLTEREVEVLAEVAAGKSNREIAGALFISEKTVARHLANIFAKLGLSSRTAAAAYAIEHGLARRGRG